MPFGIIVAVAPGAPSPLHDQLQRVQSAMASFDQVAILGVGLLGGSIGLALKQGGMARQVVGIGRVQSKLDAAVERGIVDRATTSLADGVQDAGLVVVCTPVETIATTVIEILKCTPAECLVTDVGSTKAAIVEQVSTAAGDKASRFVGSHPLAGDHRSGADFARGDLFADKTVVVTPGGPTSPGELTYDDLPSDGAARRVADFWHSLDAKIVLMSPEKHDAAVAATSHLPHAVAAALAAATPADLLQLAATGWADTTRVAGADAELWRQIFLANQQQVLAALDRFELQLASLRSAIASGDGDKLEQLLAEGKRNRDAMGN